MTSPVSGKRCAGGLSLGALVRSARLRAAAVLMGAAGLAAIAGIGQAGDEPQRTEADVARKVGVTVAQLRRIERGRGLSHRAVLAMSREQVEEMLEQLRGPRPDSPAEAAKFQRLRARIDVKGTIPPGALAKAIKRVDDMRNAVPPPPPPSPSARVPAGVAHAAFLPPRRVAGIPVGRLRRPAPPPPSTSPTLAAAVPVLPLVAGVNPGGWTWLGPGNVGGRTRAIVVHPTIPTSIWAGSISGGVWKSTDGGASWGPVDDFMASLNVSTLLVDPADPNTLYAGTGEGFYNIDAFRGAGVFKSADGGTTWTQLAATNIPDFLFVNRLAISNDGATLLAAVRNGDGSTAGVTRSVDKGTTFTASASLAGVEILDVKFDPTDRTKAVAGGRAGRVYYTTDGGATWSAGAGVPPVPQATGLEGRVELCYSAKSPSIVYASVDNNLGEVYRSDDGGKNYVQRNTGSNYLGDQGWYANTIWAGDPTDANLVVVGGLDIYRSEDGGVTFTQISDWQSSPASPHADHHTIVKHPAYDGTTNRIVYFGNDGGIYQSSDIRTSVGTTGWTALNNNYGVTQFYGAAGNVNTGKIVAGAQDNGTVRYTPPPGASTGPQGYTSMFGGDGGYCAADPTDPNFFYGEYVYLQIHRSINGGATATYIYNGIGDATDENNANFIAPFILDPNNPNTMLAGGYRLWRTPNVKASSPAWKQIKKGLSPVTTDPAVKFSQLISAIAVARGNSKLIWVGYNGGEVWRTIDGGLNWAQVGGGSLPSGRMCTRITFDPSSSDIVYVTFGGYASENVWKTGDGGSTFASIGSALPAAPAYTLAIHPDNPRLLYLGMEVGVFASDDGGASWSPANQGPTNCSVNELFWMGRNLHAATHGRGLFSIDLSGLVPPSPAPSATIPAAVGASKAAKVRPFEIRTDPGNSK